MTRRILKYLSTDVHDFFQTVWEGVWFVRRCAHDGRIIAGDPHRFKGQWYCQRSCVTRRFNQQQAAESKPGSVLGLS